MFAPFQTDVNFEATTTRKPLSTCIDFQRELNGGMMRVQDDDLFVGSNASEDVIATSFAMESGVRKRGRYGVQK